MSNPGHYRIGSVQADLRAQQPLGQYVLIDVHSTSYQIISDMTERVIRALQTNSARRGLEKIAEGWAQAHHPTASPDADSREFQLLLRSTMAHRSQWPRIMVEFLLSPENIALTDRDTPYNMSGATTFSLPEQVILLNGTVSKIVELDFRVLANYPHYSANITRGSICFFKITRLRTPSGAYVG